MFATVDEIPFTITWKRLFEEEAVAELMMVVEASIPFTVEVNTLPIEDRIFVVVARSPRIEVVAIIPFTLVVKVPPA